jgi:hypothetical protein
MLKEISSKVQISSLVTSFLNAKPSRARTGTSGHSEDGILACALDLIDGITWTR